MTKREGNAYKATTSNARTQTAGTKAFIKTVSPSKQMWCPKELRQYERNTALSRVIFSCHAIEVKCNLWFTLLIHVQCAYCDIVNLLKS